MVLPKAIQANLTYGGLDAKEVSQHTHIPITHFVGDGVFATKNQDVGIAFRIRGIAHETASIGETTSARDAMARVANSFDDGRTVLYAYTIRRKINAADRLRPVPGEGFAARFDERYRRQLAENDTYEIKHYLFAMRRKWTRKMGKLAAASNWLANQFITSEAEIADIRAKRQIDIDELNGQAESITETLAPLGVERLTGSVEDQREFLQLMTMLANGVWTSAPAADRALDRVIPCARVTFRGETLAINGATPGDNRYAAVLAISAYCHETDTGMFDALAGVRAEFIAVQVFMPMDRVEGGKAVSAGRARMRDAGDDAESLMAELEVAKDEVASRRLSMGCHHFTIAVLGETEAALTTALARVKAAVEGTDLRLKREDTGLEAAWWAQLPGNMAYQVRSDSRIISHRNYADMTAFHTHPIGETRNLRWRAPITLLETASRTPYNLSFHGPGTNTAGHAAVYGTSGSGKSTGIMSIICASRRLPQPPDIIYFDKDRVAQAAVEALGGKYFRLSPGESVGFNPFALVEDTKSAVWLTGFIERLMDCSLTPEQERRIAEAAQRNALEQDGGLKNFADFASLLKSVDNSGADHKVLDRLRAWHSEGDRSWLFGNREETFPIDEPVIGLDMTDVLDSPKIRMPVLDYLFYRIDRKLSRGHPTIIVLDEAWKLLDDPRFEERIKDWLKTGRSKNAVLIFMTQEPADAAKSGIAEALSQLTETSIAFSNPDADQRSYVDALGFTPTELGLIRGLGKESRQALIKNSRESLVVSTKLRGMDAFVKVLAGTAESVNEMDELKRIYGDEWLPVFMGEEPRLAAAE